MAFDDIQYLFSRTGIWRWKDLQEEGISFRDITRALNEKLVVRPIVAGRVPVPGVFVTPDLNMDPDRALIIGTFVTGGVIGRNSAGQHYQMTTALPPRTEIHVRESFTRVPPYLSMLALRSRNERFRTVGVESFDTEHGYAVPITNRARTVVDLIHSGRTDDRDYSHAHEAIESFLAGGGEPHEITSMADALGLDWDGRVTLLVDAVDAAMGNDGGPKC